MPLPPGEDVSTAIRELHTGKTYSHTKKKFGKKRANRQAIAIAIHNRNKGKKRRMKRHTKGGRK